MKIKIVNNRGTNHRGEKSLDPCHSHKPSLTSGQVSDSLFLAGDDFFKNLM